ARFRQEFQKLQTVGDHPGIVRTFEWGDRLIDERIVYWYSMEFADGGDLGGWIELQAQQRGGRSLWDDDNLRPELVVRFQAIADAAAHLHGLELIHRDLKPSNVLIMDDG